MQRTLSDDLENLIAMARRMVALRELNAQLFAADWTNSEDLHTACCLNDFADRLRMMLLRDALALHKPRWEMAK